MSYIYINVNMYIYIYRCINIINTYVYIIYIYIYIEIHIHIYIHMLNNRKVDNPTVQSLTSKGAPVACAAQCGPGPQGCRPGAAAGGKCSNSWWNMGY